jgi:hypothetical protein
VLHVSCVQHVKVDERTHGVSFVLTFLKHITSYEMVVSIIMLCLTTAGIVTGVDGAWPGNYEGSK